MTDWWQGCTVYEVYLPSFADSARDGRWDGLGDLPGVRAHLDHLVDLGVDVVWLTPFYPSPLADHGYDVSEYTDVDPRFGTLADLDALIADAHARGLKILGDLVVNHTSSEHPWFVAARSSVDDPHRSFYVWRDGRGSTGELPPNNWVSHFGGPAWTRDEASGQWWLHLFLPEQPDLDWSEPAVADAVDDVLRFWLARGLDGFRIDVAHGMAKHADLPDNPILSAPRSAGSSVPEWSAQEHRYDLDQPAVLDVFRRWRAIADAAGALLIGEVYLLDPARLTRYVADDGLHEALWFGLVEGGGWDPAALATSVREAARLVPHVGWPLSSHDVSRAATRFGGGTRGRSRALAVSGLLAALPDVLVVYQGEELGLTDGVVPPAAAEDPIARRNPGLAGRDGARTPMAWAPGPGLGFSTVEPWLPMGGRTDADTVAVQAIDPASPLASWRALLRLRREVRDQPAPAWLSPTGLVLRRGDTLVAANLSAAPVPVPLPTGSWRVVWASAPGAAVAAELLELPPETTVWLAAKG